MTAPRLPDFPRARVLVAGDVMLDRYWHGPASRVSPEAPVPVVRVQGLEERPGGAANVALNVAALGAGVELLGAVGEDEAAAGLARRLEAAGVRARLLPVPGAATVVKLRVLSRHQQLLRLDFEDGLPGLPGEALRAAFREALPGAGAVVLSDYAKGTLREVEALVAEAREAGLPVLVDPKGRDFRRYRGATLLTPNLAELEAAAGPCPDEAALAARAAEVLEACRLEALLVTRGERGMSLFRPGRDPLHLPARAREVYDVTGAGDTVMAVLAAALAAGAPLERAVVLANAAAGVVVARLGTAAVGPEELRWALGEEAAAVRRGVLEEEALLAELARARARGERIVMTNGCFDLLHAGHVAYLREARALGDRLLVAVNDDASVRRLKGPSRPVTPLGQRMAVLAALEAVDWVVPFAEDTPERLVRRVLPDVLVKGGDWRPEQVAGGAAVTAAGGRVVILPYREGLSTTALIRRCREAGG